jgi:hypothetical protein
MLPSVHQALPDRPIEDLARVILDDPDRALAPLPIFATVGHRLWTVFDAHPAQDAFVVLSDHTSTAYCLAAPSGTSHTTRQGLAATALQQLAEKLSSPGWEPVPREPESAYEAGVTLAKRLTASSLGLAPFDVTAQHTLVTIDLTGTYIVVEQVEEGLEIDAIAAVRYPGDASDFDQRSAAEDMLREEVSEKLTALGFEEAGDGGLPDDMGDHVCVSLSYRQVLPSFENLVACIASLRDLDLFLETDETPSH